MRSDLLVVLEDLKSEIENGVNTLAEPSDRDKLIRHLRGWLRQLQDEVEGDPDFVEETTEGVGGADVTGAY